MKKLIILSNAASTGLFKALMAKNKKIDPCGLYAKNNAHIFLFASNLTTDPLISTTFVRDLFIEREVLRQKYPEKFRSLNSLNLDKRNSEDVISIIDLAKKSQTIDIWIDSRSVSRITAIFLIKLIAESVPDALTRLNLYQYSSPIAQVAPEEWDVNKVEKINVNQELLESVNRIWLSLMLNNHRAVRDALEAEKNKNVWTYQLLDKFFRQLVYNETERELLTVINDLKNPDFFTVCSYYFWKFGDDFINWLHIPAFLDQLKSRNMLRYDDKSDVFSLRETVENGIRKNELVYDEIKISLTPEGKAFIAE